MLLIIGLGLDIKEISIKALEALKAADLIYAEQYTTFLPVGYLDYLSEVTGRPIVQLTRSQLEEEAQSTVAPAKSGTMAILVPGDPLIATTHYATIIYAARKLGISVKIYHSSSIYSAAIGSSGLDVYRFGTTVTIPYWHEKYHPVSFLDSIQKNLAGNNHSLVLLDLNQAERRPMHLEEAISILKDAEKSRAGGLVNDLLRILVLGDIARPSQAIAYISIANVQRTYGMFKGKTISIIVPSNPTVAEREALAQYEA